MPVKVCFTCNRYVTLPGKLTLPGKPVGVAAPFTGTKFLMKKANYLLPFPFLSVLAYNLLNKWRNNCPC